MLIYGIPLWRIFQMNNKDNVLNFPATDEKFAGHAIIDERDNIVVIRGIIATETPKAILLDIPQSLKLHSFQPEWFPLSTVHKIVRQPKRTPGEIKEGCILDELHVDRWIAKKKDLI